MQQFVLCLQFTHLGLVNDLQYVDIASIIVFVFLKIIYSLRIGLLRELRENQTGKLDKCF